MTSLVYISQLCMCWMNIWYKDKQTVFRHCKSNMNQQNSPCFVLCWYMFQICKSDSRRPHLFWGPLASIVWSQWRGQWWRYTKYTNRQNARLNVATVAGNSTTHKPVSLIWKHLSLTRWSYDDIMAKWSEFFCLNQNTFICLKCSFNVNVHALLNATTMSKNSWEVVKIKKKGKWANR